MNLACTVYNTRSAGESGYLFEAVHIREPTKRAYLHELSLGGMRGDILKEYIDSELKLFSDQDQEIDAEKARDQSLGFANEAVSLLVLRFSPAEFKARMKEDPTYASWQYEEGDDEDLDQDRNNMSSETRALLQR